MPGEKSGAEALSKAVMPADLRVWLPDPEGAGSYPIATYTWMIFYKKYDDPNKAKAIQELINYCLTDGQKISGKMGYIPLPESVVQEVSKAAKNIQ
jgi:phosphate transport system substrate-binding protein